MIIERLRNRDPKPICRRMMPDGLEYIDSLLQEWIAHWSDLLEFEIVPVVHSAQTRQLIEGM